MFSREEFDLEWRRRDNREGASVQGRLISAAGLGSLYGSC